MLLYFQQIAKLHHNISIIVCKQFHGCGRCSVEKLMDKKNFIDVTEYMHSGGIHSEGNIHLPAWSSLQIELIKNKTKEVEKIAALMRLVGLPT